MQFKHFHHSAFIKFVGIILFLLGSLNLNAQNSAKAFIDASQIEMGDQIGLTLQISSSSLQIRFPILNDTIIKGIDIIEKFPVDTLKADINGLLLSQKILITAFDDSTFKIPPFMFLIGKDTFLTNPLTLKVVKPKIDKDLAKKIDTTQAYAIFDIKEPIDAPWTFKEFLLDYYIYFLIIIGLALAGFIGYYFWKKRKLNKPFISFEKPKEPFFITAIRMLDVLKEKKQWQKGHFKEYYSELTDIIRLYLEDRYKITALELTSYEILFALQQLSVLKPELFDDLKRTFTLADLAKFAKAEPLANENELCLNNAYKLINETKLAASEPVKPAAEVTEIANELTK